MKRIRRCKPVGPEVSGRHLSHPVLASRIQNAIPAVAGRKKLNRARSANGNPVRIRGRRASVTAREAPTNKPLRKREGIGAAEARRPAERGASSSRSRNRCNLWCRDHPAPGCVLS